MRTRTSFQKRQKEIARMEKQRDQAAKRPQRKLGEANLEEELDTLVAAAAATQVLLAAPLEAPPHAEGQ